MWNPSSTLSSTSPQQESEFIYQNQVEEEEDTTLIPTNTTIVHISHGISSIPPNTFSNHPNLHTVLIPPSVQSIGDNAFRSCLRLRTVTFTNHDNDSNDEEEEDVGLLHIGNYAFYQCRSLQPTIHLPSTLQHLGSYVFMDCSSLQRIIVPPSITTLRSNVFHGCTLLQKLVLPSGLLRMEESVCKRCISLQTVVFSVPVGLRSIHESVFAYCVGLDIEEMERWIPKDVVVVPKKNNDQDLFGLVRDNVFYRHSPVVVHMRSKALRSLGSGGGSTQQQRRRRYDDDTNGGGLLKGDDRQRQPTTTTTTNCAYHQHGYGPLYWGISRVQLWQIKSKLLRELDTPCYTVRNFVDKVVKPITDGTGMGYAMLLNQDDPLRAKVVVCHAWDQPLHDVIDAIVRSEVEGPFWISALSVYQNDDEQKGLTVYQQMGWWWCSESEEEVKVKVKDPKQQHDDGALVTVLNGVEHMLVVVTLGFNLYERLWCLLELFTAAQKAIRVQFCPLLSRLQLERGDTDKDARIAQVSYKVDSSSARRGMYRCPVYDPTVPDHDDNNDDDENDDDGHNHCGKDGHGGGGGGGGLPHTPTTTTTPTSTSTGRSMAIPIPPPTTTSISTPIPKTRSEAITIPISTSTTTTEPIPPPLTTTITTATTPTPRSTPTPNAIIDKVVEHIRLQDLASYPTHKIAIDRTPAVLDALVDAMNLLVSRLSNTDEENRTDNIKNFETFCTDRIAELNGGFERMPKPIRRRRRRIDRGDHHYCITNSDRTTKIDVFQEWSNYLRDLTDKRIRSIAAHVTEDGTTRRRNKHSSEGGRTMNVSTAATTTTAAMPVETVLPWMSSSIPKYLYVPSSAHGVDGSGVAVNPTTLPNRSGWPDSKIA